VDKILEDQAKEEIQQPESAKEQVKETEVV